MFLAYVNTVLVMQSVHQRLTDTKKRTIFRTNGDAE